MEINDVLVILMFMTFIGLLLTGFPIAFVLGGMVAGSVGVFSLLKTAFYAYSIPALLPISIMFFRTKDDLHFAMGLMIILFWRKSGFIDGMKSVKMIPIFCYYHLFGFIEQYSARKCCKS